MPKASNGRRKIIDLVVQLHSLLRRGGVPRRILDSDQSLSLLLEDRKSLIRWGDGESGFLFGDKIYFQDYDPALQLYLKKILDGTRKAEVPYHLAFPFRRITATRRQLLEQRRLELWRNTRFIVECFCPRKNVYLDALVFKGTAEDKRHYDRVFDLWRKSERLVIVHSDPSLVARHLKASGVGATCDWVQIAAVNAFSCYEETLCRVLESASKSGFEACRDCIIISAGPAAKALVYDLSKEGFVAYDMGKFFQTEGCHLR